MRNHVERRGICPRAGDTCSDESGHFYQNADTLAFICFKCGYKGRGEIEGVHWLSEITESVRDRDPRLGKVLHQNLSIPEDGLGEDYLWAHNVHPDVAEDFGVYEKDNQLVVPYCKPGFVCNFFQTRTLRGAKQWRTYGERRGQLLLFSRIEDSKTVFLVESMISAIRLAPFSAAVATCGKTVPMETLLQLRDFSHRKRVLVWFDTDAVGESLRICEILNGFPRVRAIPVILELNEDKLDPCDVGDALVHRILKKLGNIPT